ncbi:MAG: AAA family ATPase [bacterium]
MIKLRHIAVSGFKRLKDIDLKLPEQGTFLIEGSNEAGKSSLFEASLFRYFWRAFSYRRKQRIAG